MFKEILFSALASFGFGLIFEIRGKKLIFSSLVGGIGWGVSLFIRQLGGAVVLACFISSIVISLCAEGLARYLRTPVTSVLVVGMIPLVPGGGIYYTMYYILKKDLETAIFKGTEALLIAGALSFGIVVVSSIFRIIKTGQKNRYLKPLNFKF